MNPLAVLFAGVGLMVLAVLITLFITFRPRRKGIDVTRRRPFSPDAKTSMITKLGAVSVAAVERRMGPKISGPFGRDALGGAGMKSTPSEFLVMVLAASLLLTAVGVVMQGLLTGLLMALGGPLGAWLLVKFRTSRRYAAFEGQLSDMLMSVSGSLRAGHGVAQSLHSASVEMPAPMSEELSRIVNESRVGRPVTESMEEVGRRMRCEDFEWLSQAIQINREVGGDLASVLDHIADTVRERAQIKGQVRALAAEGKLSAYILIALPFFVAGAISFSSPGYINVLFESTLGWMIVSGGVLMMAIGSFWISRMVKIKF